MENCRRNLLLTGDNHQHWIQDPENGDQKVEPNALTKRGKGDC